MIRHVSVGAALEHAAFALTEAGIDEPRRRARALLAAALDLSAAEIFAYPERLLTSTQQARVSVMLDRMLAHEPLSRIIGRREFWGLEFRLSADTLDPRPESETIVEAVLARLPERDRPYRFLDLGTGTGCLLLALLSEYPAASGIGIDIAPGAARTARDNAERLGIGGRAQFAVGSWAAALTGRFDAVVANPPYIERADDRRAAARGAAIRSDPGARRRRRRARRVPRDRRRTAAIVAARAASSPPRSARDRPPPWRKFSGSTVCNWTGSPPISPASSALSSPADSAVPAKLRPIPSESRAPLARAPTPGHTPDRAKTGNGGGSRCASALSDWG